MDNSSIGYEMAADGLFSHLALTVPIPIRLQIPTYIHFFTLDTPKHLETAIRVLHYKQLHTYGLHV